MPPLLASVLILGFVAWLFRRDFREQPNVTRALWLPTLWLLIIGSRTAAQWLDLIGGLGGGGSNEEGTPVDAVFYFLLILAGARVLYQRRINLAGIMAHNRWLSFFLIYCFLAIFWSDYEFVAFKRWIKILGHPIMTLVIFTEPDPEEAVIRLMKRCAYIILPVSILFIKYYPQWSHENNPFGGPAGLTGISLDKNMMGSVCMILGLFFFWHMLKTWSAEKTRSRRNELFLCVVFLGMIGWLLYSVKSSTSTVSMLVGVAFMLFIGFRFVNQQRIGTYLITAGILFGLAEMFFGIIDLVLDLLGKDPTLTDRTNVWKLVLEVQTNLFFGAGFESFWLGERREEIWRHFWWHPIQAHNGYLETYLSLGLVGLGLMLVLIVATFFKGQRALLAGFEFGRFRLGFLVAFVLYNWTEAAFKATHPVWFVFYIIAIDYPRTWWPPDPSGVKVEMAAERVAFEGEIVA
jgi:O-antigen ligase